MTPITSSDSQRIYDLLTRPDLGMKYVTTFFWIRSDRWLIRSRGGHISSGLATAFEIRVSIACCIKFCIDLASIFCIVKPAANNDYRLQHRMSAKHNHVLAIEFCFHTLIPTPCLPKIRLCCGSWPCQLHISLNQDIQHCFLLIIIHK